MKVREEKGGLGRCDGRLEVRWIEEGDLVAWVRGEKGERVDGIIGRHWARGLRLVKTKHTSDE